MRPLDRQDLINLVAYGAPAPACRRACLTGTVEVLGGFSEVPPSTSPGWIVRVTTKRGNVHLVGISPDDIWHKYWVRAVDAVPWHLWEGSPCDPAVYSIYSGDHPETYRTRRSVAQELTCSASNTTDQP